MARSPLGRCGLPSPTGLGPAAGVVSMGRSPLGRCGLPSPTGRGACGRRRFGGLAPRWVAAGCQVRPAGRITPLDGAATFSPPRSLPGSRHSKRTRPVAMMRPSSSRAVASQTWERRPRVSGVAVTRTRPARAARMKLVWFSTPTTLWPRAMASNAAPVEQADSMAAQCTPPCTMPYGCRCFASMSYSMHHLVARGALTKRKSIAVSNPALQSRPS